MNALQLAQRLARERAGVVVAAGHVRRHSIGNGVEHVDVGRDRSRLEARHHSRAGTDAGIERDHGPFVADRHDDGRRGAPRPALDQGDALGAERLAEKVGRVVAAERRGERGREAKARARNGVDRASTGRADEVSGEALLARAWQRLESDEREIQKRGDRDCDIDWHPSEDSGTSGAPEHPSGFRQEYCARDVDRRLS